VYTIQTGSFDDMESADAQFDTIVHSLQGSEIDHLRIEQIGNYFCVRMGKFEAYHDARKFLDRLQPLVHDTLLMEGYVKDERIRRSYSASLSAADNDAEVKEPSQPLRDYSLMHDAERIEGEGGSGPGKEEPGAQNLGEGKTVSRPVDIKEEDERLSLSIQDADIRSVLKALSSRKKLNIVAGQDVKGTISVNLYDLPLKEVLDAIITMNGFSYTQKDNIIHVSKAVENSEEDLPETDIMTFKLKYADIDEAEKVVAKLVTESAKITYYKPEKTLIVEDTPHNLNGVKQVLETLDIPPRQVFIETRIMSVRVNDDTSLGIDWSDTFSGFFNSSGNVLTQGFARPETLLSQGFFFNVMNSDFNLLLDALQTITEVSFISSPRVLALDNKEARILIGDMLGYYVTTATEAAVLQSVEFLDTGTQLIITPHIVDNETIIMDIHPEISDGSIIDGLPSKNTAEVTTSLMAPDGGTVFIGGLIRDRKEDIKERVPGLGSIPVIGALFGRTTNITVRNEIIVLITPHIISNANIEILEGENQKVNETEKNLKRERSLKELIPGTK
jgi:type IV pilus assembly protein PilQ